MKSVVIIKSVGNTALNAPYAFLRSMLTFVLCFLVLCPLSVPTFAFASDEKETKSQQQNTSQDAVQKTLRAAKSLAPTGHTQPAKVIYARSTYYNKDEPDADADTKRGKTSFEVPVPTVKAHGLNVVAVNPSIIPYGSLVITPCGQKFVAGDSGGAVIGRTAAKELAGKKRLPKNSAEANALVLDFYAYGQIGKQWDRFYVIPYQGPKSFRKLSLSEKKAWLIKLRNA